jgi:23S rRNA (uracil1939-C5)-methyltransferase
VFPYAHRALGGSTSSALTSAAASTTRPRPGDEVVVTVERLTYGGQGIARAQGLAVFVSGAAPRETVRARVRRTFRRHVEADVVGIEHASPDRVEPRCQHYRQGCGGCSWQHVAYPAQLSAKEAAVRDSLERLGGFREIPMHPIVPAPDPFFYRNKMEFAFHPEGTLGLHPREAWYDIIRLRECFLESPLAVAIVKAAQTFVEERRIPLYHPRTRQGLLRELCIRHARGGRETLVGIVTGPGPFPEAEAMATHLAAIDPGIKAVVRGVRHAPETAAPLAETTVLVGQDHITEIVAGLQFKIRLDTFFQTNSAQAERLVAMVKQFAGDVANARVVDVYCGVGLFSLVLGVAGARVVGIEIAASAVLAARENAAKNQVSSTEFYAGDARKLLAEVLPAGLAPKVLVLDPPRAGAGGKVMRRIARSSPERIIYVSCNPTTLARDLVELRPFGYKMTAVSPIDLFPQTYHVETVVALERT